MPIHPRPPRTAALILVLSVSVTGVLVYVLLYQPTWLL